MIYEPQKKCSKNLWTFYVTWPAGIIQSDGSKIGRKEEPTMCSITLIAQDVTMATTQVMQTASKRVSWTRQEEARPELRPLRMNWVVVTDENHIRRVQMCWTPSAGNR